FFFQAEDGIRYYKVTGVQTCALPICVPPYTFRIYREGTDEPLLTISGLLVARASFDQGKLRPGGFHVVVEDSKEALSGGPLRIQIGRASCRERVVVSVVVVEVISITG